MPDKNPFRNAALASDRLREVLDSMRDIWRKSMDEAQPDSSINLYIVDADVVTMFMGPLMKHNYGALLRYGGHARKDTSSGLKELETRLVEFLGNLIFFQLRPAIPLLLLPDHADDLERILNKVWEKALIEQGTWEGIRASIEESGSNVVEISKTQLASADQRLAERKGKAQAVKELLDKIFRSLRGEGAVGELFRFDELVSAGRLCHLDRIALQDEKGQRRYLPPPLNEAGKFIPSVSRLADRLYRAMSQLSVTKNPSRRFWIKRDAQALAHLAWLNTLFSQEKWYIETGDGSSPRRIGKAVLITGSYLLPQAINELELEPLSGCVTAPLSFLGHRLMDEYFRRSKDRQQPLMEEDSQGSQASALINFFDSMRAVLNSAIKTRNTDKINRAVKEVGSHHYKLIEKWHNRQIFGEHSRMEAVSTAIASLEESGRSMEGLKNFLEELSVDAWQRFARSVTMLNLKSATADLAVQRNIPPVRFMQFDIAREISGKLYCTGDNEKARENALAIMDKPTIRKLRREDPSDYTEFVCYALFGLVHRTLRMAEGCAEVAWSIAQAKPTKGKFAQYIKGDEALYLLAHIIRLRARRKEHLGRAENCIKLALEASRQASDAESIDYVDDIRLLTERFSIHCHQRYFECLGAVGCWLPRSRLERNLGKLKFTYFEGIKLLAQINETVPESSEHYVFEYVKQQILVNLAQLSLFWLYPAERTGDEKIEFFYSLEQDAKLNINKKDRERFKLLSEQLLDQCQMLAMDKTGMMPKPSILSTSVAAVSSSIFLNKHDLDKWFRPNDGKVAAVDGLRFKYLKSVYCYCRKLAGGQGG